MRKKIFVGRLLAGTLLTTYLCSSVCTYASYDRMKARNYAIDNYNDTDSGAYYYFSGSNCTNFVSQCLVYGGVSQVNNPEFVNQSVLPTTLYIFDGDKTYRYWFMKKKISKIEFNRPYYLTTQNWTVVKEFRIYQNHHRGTAYEYNNTASGRQALINKLNIGDIVQVGDEHSVIITAIEDFTAGDVKYCGQSSSRCNEPLSTLFRFADQKECSKLYLIKLK